VEELRREFVAAMDDDCNTARALAALYDLAREINTYLATTSGPEPAAVQRQPASWNSWGEMSWGSSAARSRAWIVPSWLA
jgi:cysteinyl-tRNA synthetase